MWKCECSDNEHLAEWERKGGPRRAVQAPQGKSWPAHLHWRWALALQIHFQNMLHMTRPCLKLPWEGTSPCHSLINKGENALTLCSFYVTKNWKMHPFSYEAWQLFKRDHTVSLTAGASPHLWSSNSERKPCRQKSVTSGLQLGPLPRFSWGLWPPALLTLNPSAQGPRLFTSKRILVEG